MSKQKTFPSLCAYSPTIAGAADDRDWQTATTAAAAVASADTAAAAAAVDTVAVSNVSMPAACAVAAAVLQILTSEGWGCTGVASVEATTDTVTHTDAAITTAAVICYEGCRRLGRAERTLPCGECSHGRSPTVVLQWGAEWER